jgi:putative transposase
MPYRTSLPVCGEKYHAYNRSVAAETIFRNVREYNHFYQMVQYYQYDPVPCRFSQFRNLSLEIRAGVIDRIHRNSTKSVEIYAFAFMPTHFHFVLSPLIENGVSVFLRKLEDGYAKYDNVKTKRHGAIFQSMFKCGRIESDEQFLQVVRYVHLNPIKKGIVLSLNDLGSYPWTSYPEYISEIKNPVVSTSTVLSLFSGVDSFKEFMGDTQYPVEQLLPTTILHDVDI